MVLAKRDGAGAVTSLIAPDALREFQRVSEIGHKSAGVTILRMTMPSAAAQGAFYDAEFRN